MSNGIFNEGVLVEQLNKLLNHRQAVLRARTCTMIRLLGRFCCRALQQVWDRSLRNLIEGLTEDEDEQVRHVSKLLMQCVLSNLNFI